MQCLRKAIHSFYKWNVTFHTNASQCRTENYTNRAQIKENGHKKERGRAMNSTHKWQNYENG